MTRDGFGIKHPDHCQRPLWHTARARGGGPHYQRCKSCGITWKPDRDEEHRRNIADQHNIPLTILPKTNRKEIDAYTQKLLAFARPNHGQKGPDAL